MMMDGTGCGMMGAAMLLVGLVFLGLLALGIWLVVRAVSGSLGTPPRHHSPALTILEERYARGELDHEEFEQRRRALTDTAR
jgi:putative membrane protein